MNGTGDSSNAVTARERMLTRIRERQGKDPLPHASERAAVQGHIKAHPRSPAPAIRSELVQLFRDRALSLASTFESVPRRTDVPGCVASYLDAHALPREAVCWRELVDLDWIASGIEVGARSARDDDAVGITGACCGIAETGTLVVLSGSFTPPSVSLLPETHVAVLARSRILGSMEDAWDLIRREHTQLPRAVTFVSGPSRTADIEQTVTLGAHGPYRVHIIVYDA